MLTARDNAVLLHAPNCDPQPVAYCNSAADALLFAAAPDLLAALETCLPYVERDTVAAQARAVIRKATGGSDGRSGGQRK